MEFEEQAHEIQLDINEAMYLDSVLRNEDQEQGTNARPLILKVDCALKSLYEQQQGDGAAYAIVLDEKEAWLLRDKISPAAKQDGKPMGLVLKLKVIAVMQHYDEEEAAKEALADLQKYHLEERITKRRQPRHRRKAAMSTEQ